MLLYKGIITLDYDPATDVLVAVLPDARQFGLSEIAMCLGLVVESVRSYDIKLLLLDAVGTEGEGQGAAYASFISELSKTRLRKMARLAGADDGWQERSARIAAEGRQGPHRPLEFRSFDSQAEALGWLVSSVPA
ncbi:hypothetical protein [Pontibacter chitinilyticus]|uniref:hypothetical protein n=1 Tax=Pontibacter chitinilyticus TaxID=2674989 RepID=UPI00321AC170